MKKVALLFAFAFVAAPAFANAPNTDTEEEMENLKCHTYACQVAEQGASLGADIEAVYEMAYEDCAS